MKKEQRVHLKSILNWIARLLGILFTVFISLFALDVFQSGVPLGETLIALLIHLIPTYIILILLWIAWKRPQVGGLLFILAGAAYLILVSNQDLTAILLLTGIPVLIGLIFLTSSSLKNSSTN
jgi:hypothetical protein